MSVAVTIKESGLVLIRGLHLHPSAAMNLTYLRKVRGEETTWWTSWRWLMLLKGALRWKNVPIVEGREHLQALVSIARQALALKTKPPEEPKNGLWPWQRQAAAAMLYSPRYYLCDQVGLGKTASVLSALLTLRDAGEVKNALVVTVASVKYQWREELDRLIIGYSKLPAKGDLAPSTVPKVVVVDGAREARKKLWEEEAFLHIANYEGLRADLQEKGPSGKGNRVLWRSFDAIVLDEAWKVKRHTAMVSKALAKYVEEANIPRRYALNATPVTNHYQDIYGVYRILDPLLFISWKNFADRYLVFTRIKTGKVGKWGREIIFPKLTGYRRTDEFQKMIAPTFLRRTGEDIGENRPSVLSSWYWVDLTEGQRRLYELIQMDEDMNDLARTVRARMTCLLHDPPEENPKILTLLDLFEDALAGRKAVVFSESTQFLETVLPIIRKKKIATGYISGEDSAKERELKCQAFTRGMTQVLLATAAGEAGLNLQAADVVVNLDLPWSPARIEQRIGRVRPYLGGKERVVTVVNILARDTIEERVVTAIRKKLGDISRLFQGKLDPTVEAVFDPKILVGQL